MTVRLIIVTACQVASLGAQVPTRSVSGAVRPLPAAIASSAAPLGSIAGVRGLSNGSVLVNDQVSRRVLLLDAYLKVVRVVADSTPVTNNAYGSSAGGLIPYRSDTTFFVDPASMSFLVIDPLGNIVRTMATPRPNDVSYLLGGIQSTPGFDAHGRLVYRGRTPYVPMDLSTDPVIADSAPIVRVDLATRKADTLTYPRIWKTIVKVTRDAAGKIMTLDQSPNNVLPVIDEWVVLSGGTTAIVRGRDYRVDFINSDGVMTKGAKIPYDWEPISDEKKQELLDSVRVYREKIRAERLRDAGVVNGSVGVSGAGAGSAAVAATSRSVRPMVILLPDVADLPDYRPAFGVGGVRADEANRLWVRTTAVLQSGGGAIYDVIDAEGKRADRVQLPLAATIAGFGKSVVYYAFRDESGIYLRKAPVN